MTEPQQPGNKELPDFKQLDDRFIAKQGLSEPRLVIKTNLDPEDPTINNPYIKKTSDSNSALINDFFND